MAGMPVGTVAQRRPLPSTDVMSQRALNILLAHADRSRVIAVAFRPAIFTSSLLVDGFVAATWKIIRQAGRATLVIETFKPLKKSDREAVGEEGTRLLTFAASDAAGHDIQFKRAD